MMYNHRTAVGHTDRIDNTTKKIEGEGTLSIENKITNRIKNAAGNEFPYEMSLGMDARKIKLTYHPNGTTVNGRTITKEMYVIKNTIVDEVTICEQGRDSNTSMRLLNSKFNKSQLKRLRNTAPVDDLPPKKKKKPVSSKTAEEILKEAKLLNISVQEYKKLLLKKAASKIKNSPPTPGKRTMKRKVSFGTILRLNNKYPESVDIIGRAADENWSKEQILNAIKLRRIENGLPSPVKVGKAGAESEKLMEARILNALIEGDEKEKIMIKRYGEKLAERVMNMPMIGVKEWLVQSAQRMGENSFSGHSDVGRLVNFIGRTNRAFQSGRINNTGFSSFDMPNFFNRVTAITIEESWKLKGFFAKDMCYKTSQSDFKKTQRFRPSGGTMWEGLDQDGKIKHGAFGEEASYETSLDTKAQIVMFNRVIIKNDDFGAIREMIQLMLEGAEMVPDHKLVQHMLQAPGAFFSAYAADTETGGNGTGNDYRNALAALNETSLALAYDLASEQTINKGKVNWLNDIGDNWTIVVATRAMERVAWELIEQSEFVSNTTANTKQTKKNYWYKRFNVRRFPQLANKTFNEWAKRDTWFLWPSESRFAPFAINWLDGIERPTVETVDAPVDMLGFGTRGYIDVEINDREPEAIVRMRPTADSAGAD